MSRILEPIILFYTLTALLIVRWISRHCVIEIVIVIAKPTAGHPTPALTYSFFKNAFASSSCGKSFSSAWNSGPCTQRRLPRSFTGCLRCSIS
jgi:hypothetical protein